MGQYFGTSQNGIENKQSGTEGVLIIQILFLILRLHILVNYFRKFLSEIKKIGKLLMIVFSIFNKKIKKKNNNNIFNFQQNFS